MNQEITLRITGMSCNMCVKHVTKALAGIPGVSQVEVVLDPGQATVTYNPELTGMEQFKTAVSEAGYEVVE